MAKKSNSINIFKDYPRIGVLYENFINNGGDIRFYSEEKLVSARNAVRSLGNFNEEERNKIGFYESVAQEVGFYMGFIEAIRLIKECG